MILLFIFQGKQGDKNRICFQHWKHRSVQSPLPALFYCLYVIARLSAKDSFLYLCRRGLSIVSLQTEQSWAFLIFSNPQIILTSLSEFRFLLLKKNIKENLKFNLNYHFTFLSPSELNLPKDKSCIAIHGLIISMGPTLIVIFAYVLH